MNEPQVHELAQISDEQWARIIDDEWADRQERQDQVLAKWQTPVTLGDLVVMDRQMLMTVIRVHAINTRYGQRDDELRWAIARDLGLLSSAS